MQKYKIIVAYDGTNFHGWQIQPTDLTITSCLEKTFQNVFGRTIILIGASRTDAGVHALGQVAQFYTDLNIAEDSMREAWNKSLPSSIVIRLLEKVSEDFHPCRRVKQKTYYYHLFLRRPLPFVARYGWFYRYIDQVDWEKFHECMNLYLGTHDFSSFCKNDEKKDPVRTIDEISVKILSQWSVVQVVIKGKSFLRFQIRRMIGYALDVAHRNDLTVDYLKDVMDSKDPRQILIKAEARGLCLRKVVYHDE